MRAKFEAHAITRFGGFSGIKVELLPVTRSGHPENTSFWNATPAGKVELTITNPKAVEFFQPGKEYYLDFTEVE